MNWLRVRSTIVMLAAGGLFTSAIVWYAWERVWIWRRQALRDYAIDFRRSGRRADPAMPILLVICGTAAARFASQTVGVSRALALTAIGFLVTILVSSIIIAEPINSQFLRRREGEVPPVFFGYTVRPSGEVYWFANLTSADGTCRARAS